MPHPDDHARIRAERDLFLGLLDLAACDDLDALLVGTATLLGRLMDASQLYVELWDAAGTPIWTHARDADDHEIQAYQVLLSRGIIREATRTGRTVVTRAAAADPRFEGRESARKLGLRQVLCVPVGAAPARGAVFLQRPPGAAFTEEHQRLGELFASRVQPALDRLIRRSLEPSDDATAGTRATMDAAEIVGRSPALARVLEAIAEVAPTDLPVLLTGESGVGKTHLARAVHRNSARRRGPFLDINVANLPDTLFEAELFGAERGAFTGADRARPGRVETARGGTLLLDEVGELTPAAQAKLLQFLDTGTYFRVGSGAPSRADVRIVCATNRDLASEVLAGRFRRDLFYRISAYPIEIPSLAARPGDVPLLARAFLARMGHPDSAEGFSPAAEVALMTREWPGEARELQHVVQRAWIRARARHAARIEPEHLAGSEAEPPATFHDLTREFQRALVARALADADGDVGEVARRLDLARSYVYKLIAQHGLGRTA